MTRVQSDAELMTDAAEWIAALVEATGLNENNMLVVGAQNCARRLQDAANEQRAA